MNIPVDDGVLDSACDCVELPVDVCVGVSVGTMVWVVVSDPVLVSVNAIDNVGV